jgi:hypothetical protein
VAGFGPRRITTSTFETPALALAVPAIVPTGWAAEVMRFVIAAGMAPIVPVGIQETSAVHFDSH